ncbi:hypothetical protein D9M70_491900 [compost metagenome]
MESSSIGRIGHITCTESDIATASTWCRTVSAGTRIVREQRQPDIRRIRRIDRVQYIAQRHDLGLTLSLPTVPALGVAAPVRAVVNQDHDIGRLSSAADADEDVDILGHATQRHRHKGAGDNQRDAFPD